MALLRTSTRLFRRFAAVAPEAPPVRSIPAERWRVVRALLRDDLVSLDPSLPSLMHMLDERGAGECWHKHGTFKASGKPAARECAGRGGACARHACGLRAQRRPRSRAASALARPPSLPPRAQEHLVDTHNVLRVWGQPDYLCRLGLFHSAYSNSYVNLAIFDASTDRQAVARAIGAEAEALTFKLCVVPRHDLVWDCLAEDGRVPADGLRTQHIRTGEPVHLSASECRDLLVFTMADIAEQYAGWYDEVFQVQRPRGGAIFKKGASRSTEGHDAAALWPGACRPGLWVSHVQRLARAAATAPGGTPLPPVLVGGGVLTEAAELGARDLYVEATSGGLGGGSGAAGRAEVAARLAEAHALNPWVGEPLTVLAQCQLAAGDFEAAEDSAARALALHASWGTSWDKRMRWAGWLAWTRVLLQRARDREPWPTSAWAAVNLGLVR
jgi:hypothetical protein